MNRVTGHLPRSDEVFRAAELAGLTAIDQAHGLLASAAFLASHHRDALNDRARLRVQANNAEERFRRREASTIRGYLFPDVEESGLPVESLVTDLTEVNARAQKVMLRERQQNLQLSITFQRHFG